jgi:hypothetical protein
MVWPPLWHLSVPGLARGAVGAFANVFSGTGIGASDILKLKQAKLYSVGV